MEDMFASVNNSYMIEGMPFVEIRDKSLNFIL